MKCDDLHPRPGSKVSETRDEAGLLVCRGERRNGKDMSYSVP